MTKSEVYKWLNDRTLEHEKNLKESMSNYTLNPDSIKLMAKVKALEDLVADLIEKQF